jgi:hypothetical protein
MARLSLVTVCNLAGKRMAQPAIYTCAAVTLRHSFVVTAGVVRETRRSRSTGGSAPGFSSRFSFMIPNVRLSLNFCN